jgi:hypothetical protein
MPRRKKGREKGIDLDAGLASKEQVNEVFMGTTYDEMFEALRTLLLSLKFLVIGNLPCIENLVAYVNAAVGGSASWTLTVIPRRVPPYFLPVAVTDKTHALIDAVNRVSGGLLSRDEADRAFGVVFIQNDLRCENPSTYFLISRGDIDAAVDTLIRGILAKPLPIYRACATERYLAGSAPE